MADSRLSRIETQWSMIRMANGQHHDANLAQAKLVDQYGPPIRRYLMASLRNEEAADDVFQEFSLRLVRGDFKNADSSRGKFRNFIKTTLYRLMIDHHRRKKKTDRVGLGKGSSVLHEPVATEEQQVDEFLLAWRQSLLDNAWSRLELMEKESGKPLHTILRERVEHPELSTRQLHEHLSENSPISIPAEGSFRVYLHRARRCFANILLDLVAESLVDASREVLEEELIELGLHHYCVAAIADRF